MENITHTRWGFFKYSVTENFSRAGEFCFHKQTMNSSCLYTCLVQITNNNKTKKKIKIGPKISSGNISNKNYTYPTA